LANTVYEIHRYLANSFQYVVARTNKYSEEKIKADVQRMNEMLSDEMRLQGIRYVFAIGSTTDKIISASRRASKNKSALSND
jgi:hypothetical protein